MKKTFVIGLIIFTFCDKSKALPQNDFKKESVYMNLLSRFDCNIGPNVNKPEWICNKFAPEGWGNFYGEKLRIQKINRKKLVNNKNI